MQKRDLAKKITAFLDRHAMERTRLGLEAANDSHLIHDILNGIRIPRRITVRKIEDYMASYGKRNGGRK